MIAHLAPESVRSNANAASVKRRKKKLVVYIYIIISVDGLLVFNWSMPNIACWLVLDHQQSLVFAQFDVANVPIFLCKLSFFHEFQAMVLGILQIHFTARKLLLGWVLLLWMGCGGADSQGKTRRYVALRLCCPHSPLPTPCGHSSLEKQSICPCVLPFVRVLLILHISMVQRKDGGSGIPLQQKN